MLTWPDKDPTENLDYSLDWSARLGSDSIVSSTFTLTNSANVAITANTFTTAVTTVWLSGGDVGQMAIVTNHVTTNGGRQFEESVNLMIRDK